MGEYAEMAMERDWERHIDSIDRFDYEDIYDYPGVTTIRGSRKNKTESGLPYEDWPIGTELMVRQFKGNLTDLRYNMVCSVVRQTEKAVLFKVDKNVELELESDVTFWLPKSVLYRKEDEIKVVYAKYWATINGCEKLEL